MKKLSFVILLAVLAISCTKEQPTNPNAATITGKVLSGDAKEVEFSNIVDNPIRGTGPTYRAEIQEDSTFTIEIPLDRIGDGRIQCGIYFHDISLLPGDNFKVEIDGDTIRYEGKGAAKNEFLYLIEKENVSNGRFFDNFNAGKLLPEEFNKENLEIKQKRLDLLASFSADNRLEDEFVNKFKLDTRELSENLIVEYPEIYCYLNSLPWDSLELSDEYHKLAALSNYTDDAKTASSLYVRNVIGMVYGKARDIMYADTSIKWQEAFDTVLYDSIPNKTGVYVLTYSILNQFSRNTYDTAKIEKFNSIKKDELAQKTFDEALAKYKEKQALIGKPIHEEFAQTVLKDTLGKELTFGEVMADMKGKVVYMDCWSMGCGPCIAAMPESHKLKDKLKDLPIEFIYITMDNPDRELWERIFKTTQTKKNHYVMVNGHDSRLNEFMEINWVPNYMIFDKAGNLIDPNANRPYNVQQDKESDLEKTLRNLATS